MPGWIELVTFGLALLGAVLGVLNTWRTLNRDRVKLRVRFTYGFAINAPHLPDRSYGVEVTNLSIFPLTVTDVGLYLHGTTDRLAFLRHFTTENDRLPRKLEPREQVTVYVPVEAVKRGLPYKGVYAKTACGVTVKKREKDLLQKKADE